MSLSWAVQRGTWKEKTVYSCNRESEWRVSQLKSFIYYLLPSPLWAHKLTSFGQQSAHWSVLFSKCWIFFFFLSVSGGGNCQCKGLEVGLCLGYWRNSGPYVVGWNWMSKVKTGWRWGREGTCRALWPSGLTLREVGELSAKEGRIQSLFVTVPTKLLCPS